MKTKKSKLVAFVGTKSALSENSLKQVKGGAINMYLDIVGIPGESCNGAGLAPVCHDLRTNVVA